MTTKFGIVLDRPQWWRHTVKPAKDRIEMLEREMDELKGAAASVASNWHDKDCQRKLVAVLSSLDKLKAGE